MPPPSPSAGLPEDPAAACPPPPPSARARRLAVVWHSRTGTAEALARALAEAAAAAWAGDGTVVLLEAGEACPEELLAADAFAFACPENLGTMSGAMKEMFDRAYYPLLGRVEGRGYVTLVAGGTDGSGATAQIDRIVTGWRLRRLAPPLIVRTGAQTPEAIAAPKVPDPASLDAARELGAALAEGLALGIW